MKNIGFIGMGNMAQAIVSGWINKNLLNSDQVYAYAPHFDKLEKNAKRIGFTPCHTLKEVVSLCDTLIMACKPYQIESVLGEIKEDLKGKTLISVAAGWTFEKYSNYLDSSTHVQYIMPNTPAMVSEGVMLFEQTNSLSEEEHEEVIELFKALGLVEVLPDHLMNIGMAITGCGPAFVDLIIEALGDAGVKYGLQRKQAYALASQMILGSAKLQLETGEHPGVLKDNVCSPAGTTIKGVDALEHNGIRAAFIDAIDAIM
ncbi:MAG: pyrroline-5-carboxylate reductase [Eubacteriales bacterium]|nr:pyrroline-5-carboxylate reductase [Eubacteriales bacterium]